MGRVMVGTVGSDGKEGDEGRVEGDGESSRGE